MVPSLLLKKASGYLIEFEEFNGSRYGYEKQMEDQSPRFEIQNE